MIVKARGQCTPGKDAEIGLSMHILGKSLLHKQRKKVLEIRMSGQKPLQGFEDLVFVTKDNRPIWDSSIDCSLYAAVDRINKKNPDIHFERVHAHTLRHTFVSLCNESGVNPKVTQTLVGHSDISMTLGRHTHLSEEMKATEMKKIVGLPEVSCQ